MKDTLTQCKLLKQISKTSYIEQIVYIPTKYAIKDQIIKIKNDDDEWVDGWKVVDVYNTVDDVVSSCQSRKRHRKNTGDSLPKGN